LLWFSRIGNIEKKQSSDFSKSDSDKQDITVHPKSMGVVSGKDAHVSDPPLPSKCVKKESSNDVSKSENDKQDVTALPKSMGVVSGKDAHVSGPPVPSKCIKKENSNNVEDEDLFISVKDGNTMSNDSTEVVLTSSTTMTCESGLRDAAIASTSEDSAPKLVCFQPKPLESTGDDSCKIVEVAQATGGTLNEIPPGVQMSHNVYPPDDKLDKADLKQEGFVDQSSALENSLRDIVIPEQSYIWQYDIFSSLLSLLPLTS
jgi:hypothetical protein